MTRSVVRALALPLLLWACGPEEEELPPVEPALELGGGVDAFEPLEDGDEVFVVYGPQGGYHLDGSLRVQGINAGNTDDLSDPSNPTVYFRVFRGAEQLDIGQFYIQGIRPVDGERETYEMVGRKVILAIDDDSEVDGDTVEMSVTVEDVDGVELTDSRSLVVVPHPLN